MGNHTTRSFEFDRRTRDRRGGHKSRNMYGDGWLCWSSPEARRVQKRKAHKSDRLSAEADLRSLVDDKIEEDEIAAKEFEKEMEYFDPLSDYYSACENEDLWRDYE